MKKLQVRTAAGSWAWVFCRNTQRQDSLITTPHKAHALPPAAIWAQDDLDWARRTWSDREFRLAHSLED